MASIGFRCWKDRFAFVVLEGTTGAPVVIDHGLRTAPVDHERPDALAWLRREVHELLELHSDVSIGFYKAAEGVSRSPMAERHEFEGVLQEAAVSSNRHLPVAARVKSQIRRDTGFDRAARYVGQMREHPALAGLAADKYSDAVLAALCGLPKG